MSDNWVVQNLQNALDTWNEKLAELLNISGEQMSYITNADAGCGLIKYGSSLVPFINKFPKNTRLYKRMTTKPGEDNANRNRMWLIFSVILFIITIREREGTNRQ